MVIGLLICEVLEEEMLHLIASDPEFKKITFIKTDPGTDLIAGLGQKAGDRLSVIPDFEDFRPDPEAPLEVLATVLRVGLHVDKELLQQGIVEQGTKLAEKSDVLLLGYGLCGNVLLDIEKQMAHVLCPIVMPEHADGTKVDDCVCMVLGGADKYLDHVRKQAGTWFVTPGWLKHWETLLVKELHCKDIASVKFVFDRTGYKRCLMVNTGIAEYDKYRVATEDFAKVFNFYIEEAEGTLGIIKDSFERAKKALKQEGGDSGQFGVS
jgi:hypothetical protein